MERLKHGENVSNFFLNFWELPGNKNHRALFSTDLFSPVCLKVLNSKEEGGTQSLRKFGKKDTTGQKPVVSFV